MKNVSHFRKRECIEDFEDPTIFKFKNLAYIKEMQIKTTLRFHLTPVRIAIIKNTTNNRCWQECGEKEP
jgi:hypothetical protein